MRYELFKGEYFSDRVNSQKFRYLKEFVGEKRPKRVLDLGCGRGIISLEISELAGSVWGIDYSQENLDQARMFQKELGVRNVRFLRADAKKLPFKDNYFDMVISSEVLEHIPDPKSVLEEIVRVCKRDIWIDVPTPLWELWQVSHFMLNKLKNPRQAFKRFREIGKTGPVLGRAFQPAHVNKWFPSRWARLVGKQNLEIMETGCCFLSPIKRWNIFGFVEKRCRTKTLFKYMGMVFYIKSRKP